MISVGRKQTTFEHTIDDWVSRSLRDDRKDFRALVHSLPGIFPSEVLKSVCRLQRNRAISSTKAQTIVNSAKQKAFHITSRSLNNLLVPHPLDFDWRFDLQAVSHLTKICESISDFVICLGTPSLFEHFRRRPKTRTMFVDSNLAAIKHFGTSRFGEVVNCNCFSDPIPLVRSDVVVLDPPWYEQHSRAFLWVAAQMCNINGKVLISVPPIGTREGVASERIRLFDFARQLGLTVESIHEEVLPYETPHFEHNTLRKLGIHCLLGSWRCGTLVTFQKHFHNRVDRPVATEPHQWKEVSVFETRIRIRSVLRSRSDDPRLIPLVPGNVLNSVSRNNPIRTEVDVWTSGNRVFSCEAPNVLFEIASTISRKDANCPSSLGRIHYSPRRLVALVQILRIAKLEAEERRLLNGVQGVQLS